MSRAYTSSSRSTKARATNWARSRSRGRARWTPPSLIKAGDFKTGDVANFDRVNDGLEKIRKAVRRAGYLDVKVTSERSIDDAKKTVDVAVHIERRRAVHHGQADHRRAGPERRGGDHCASGP